MELNEVLTVGFNRPAEVVPTLDFRPNGTKTDVLGDDILTDGRI